MLLHEYIRIPINDKINTNQESIDYLMIFGNFPVI